MNKKFLTFVDTIIDDEHLKTAIVEGYFTIFESKIDVAKEVYKEYTNIYNNLQNIKLINGLYTFKSEINTIPYSLNISFHNFTAPLSAMAHYLPRVIMIYAYDLFLLLQNKNIDKIKEYLNKPHVKYAIIHELTHMYEYTKRDVDKLHKQILSANLEKLHKTDKSYFNQHIEQVPISIGTIISITQEALNKNITKPNDIYSYIINNMDAHTHNTFSNLSEKNKSKLYKTVALILDKICIDDKCDIKGLT